jgi:hypothetical protein
MEAVSPNSSTGQELQRDKTPLYTFIRTVDESFGVRIERLHELPSSTRINLGGLFISCALSEYWEAKSRMMNNEDYGNLLIDWITHVVDAVLSDVLGCTPDEAVALKQILTMHVPPFQETTPERLPPTESFVTNISSMSSCSDTDRGPFEEFLTTNVCLAPLPPVIYLRDLVVLLILQASKENRVYNARTREVLFRICKSISLDPIAIVIWETAIGEMLHGTDNISNGQARVSNNTKWTNRAKIGAATVGGAALLAITGGLALPAISAAVATVGISLSSIGLGAVGSVLVGGSVLLGSLGVAGGMIVFGGVGAGLAGFKLSKRWGELDTDDFRFTRIVRRKNKKQTQEEEPMSDALEIVVCVSGYLRTPRDYHDPWRCVRKYNDGLADAYSLHWERKNLLSLGTVLIQMVASEVAGTLTNIWLNATLGAVAAPVTFPVMVITSMGDLDNSWLVVRDRAYQCGEALAYSITNEELIGLRPVTLVGYSMGALAIFSCLQQLALNGHINRVQNVVLMGSPIPATFAFENQRIPWKQARSAVSGRFINCYNGKDALLGFLCRYVEWGITIAGLSPVNEDGVENVDVSNIVAGHSDYPAKSKDILEAVGFIQS